MPSIGPYHFTDTDTARTLALGGEWWRQLGAGVDHAPIRPIGEALVTALARIAGVPGPRTEAVDTDLDVLGPELAEDPAWAAAALGELWASVHEAAAVLRASGAIATSGGGVVDQISRSGGGVPKLPVAAVEVGFGGVVGDRQGNRIHHGRPWQALCLWSSEIIAGLAAEGHPISAGAAGENLTIGGLDWSTMHAGLRLRIGTVLAETTAWAVPCRHNAPWFSDGRFDRIHHKHGPVSRIYATVIEPGRIAAGDAVTLVTDR